MGTDREWGQRSTPVLPPDRSPAEFQTFLGLRIAAEVTRELGTSFSRSFPGLRSCSTQSVGSWPTAELTDAGGQRRPNW